MSFGQPLRLELPSITLAGRVLGPEDGVPVIVLHGWLDNANSFARLAPKLEGLRLVCLDLAGHGLSAHRPAGGGYALWEFVRDILEAADHLGWQRFSLIGHSLGGILSAMLAGAVPERVERLLLIDGVLPMLGEPQHAAADMGHALQTLMAHGQKRKTVHPTFESGVTARMRGLVAVSREAAQLLAERGLEEVEGGYSWRSDSRLTLPSILRMTEAQAWSFIERIACPTRLILGAEANLAQRAAVRERLPFEQIVLPGGHHLHLNDESGAILVADCINRFFALG